jgi:hypothetical protein
VRASDSLGGAGLGLVDDERVGPLELRAPLLELRKGQCLGTMQGGQLNVTVTVTAERLRTKVKAGHLVAVSSSAFPRNRMPEKRSRICCLR